jgi:hypothetical protein
MPSRLRHLVLDVRPQSIGYTSPRAIIERNFPRRTRASHAASLQEQIDALIADAELRVGFRNAVRPEAQDDAVQVVFEGAPGFELQLSSIESRRANIELLSVREVGLGSQATVIAAAYVPMEGLAHLLMRLTEYATKEVNGKPKNQPLIESIERVKLAVVESLWTDLPEKLPPAGTVEWWEVWLRQPTGKAARDEFSAAVSVAEIEVAADFLQLVERTVVLARGTREQMANALELTSAIAELRTVAIVVSRILRQSPQHQAEIAQEILSRVQHVPGDVAVTLLDGGVDRGHILLQQLLAQADCHTVDSNWGTHDGINHGTLMAGLAAYGDLTALLASREPVHVSHVLESSKIVPAAPLWNPPRLYGYVTQRGVYLPEIQNPQRRRVIVSTVTSATTRTTGRPSSWSAALDALSYGEGTAARLLIQSAGNGDPNLWSQYPLGPETAPVEEPGQAWNPLTVGSYTEKVRIDDPQLRGWRPLAPQGGLSPAGSCSSTWTPTWPYKPDLVLEGGNLAQAPQGGADPVPDLGLLTTSRPADGVLATAVGTSAAAVVAARMAARLASEYPNMWPETLRALMVHSARWTPMMEQRYHPWSGTTDAERALRICGYGVPREDRLMWSARDALTLVMQREIQPFAEHRKMHEMHLYELPWPQRALADLGAEQVTLRVSLSYFVEPNPSARGWVGKHRYASALLRFAVRSATEDNRRFVSRMNAAARSEEDSQFGMPLAEPGWLLGPRARTRGSIHSDVWRGTAADLARRNCIAVFPVLGWWRERESLERWARKVRYALVVSIETTAVGVDIYTPVATQVGVPVEITT